MKERLTNEQLRAEPAPISRDELVSRATKVLDVLPDDVWAMSVLLVAERMLVERSHRRIRKQERSR